MPHKNSKIIPFVVICLLPSHHRSVWSFTNFGISWVHPFHQIIFQMWSQYSKQMCHSYHTYRIGHVYSVAWTYHNKYWHSSATQLDNKRRNAHDLRLCKTISWVCILNNALCWQQQYMRSSIESYEAPNCAAAILFTLQINPTLLVPA